MVRLNESNIHTLVGYINHTKSQIFIINLQISRIALDAQALLLHTVFVHGHEACMHAHHLTTAQRNDDVIDEEVVIAIHTPIAPRRQSVIVTGSFLLSISWLTDEKNPSSANFDAL